MSTSSSVPEEPNRDPQIVVIRAYRAAEVTMRYAKERISYLVRWAELEHFTTELQYAMQKRAFNSWTPYRNEGESRPSDLALKLGATTYEFKEAGLLGLEPTLDRIEAKLADPGYVIRQSPTLDDAIRMLINGGRKDVIKAAAPSVLAGPRGGAEFLRGMRTMAGISGGPVVYVSTQVTANTIFLFQADTEAAAIAMLDPENVKLKRRIPAPASVIIKMIALRFSKVFECVRKHNQDLELQRRARAAMSQAELAALKARYAGNIPVIAPDIVLPEVRTVETLRAFIAQSRSARAYWIGGKHLTVLSQHFQELKEVLEKPTVNDEAVNAAYELQMVREVMER